MNPDQLMRMTVKDLRALAERHGTIGSAKLRKDQLIGLLTPLLENQPDPLPVPTTVPTAGSSQPAPATPVVHQGPDPGLPIPDRYGIDRIVLMVQDPQHLFIYWEIDNATYERVAAIAGPGCCPVLFIDMPGGQEQRDIDLRGGNYYLTVAPGGTYRARLALRSTDGRLHALAADSNVVQTPVMGPSDRHDEAWMAVDEQFHELLARGGLPGQGESSLTRLTRRTLSTRAVSLEGEDLTADLTVDLGDLNDQERTSSGLARQWPGAYSSHSLLSSSSLGLPSSHTLSSHSLSSGVFSSHSRWVQVPTVDLGPSPGLTQAPPATTNAVPVSTTPPASSSSGRAPAQPSQPAAPTPPPRPGQILGADTVKRSPARRRPRT